MLNEFFQTLWLSVIADKAFIRMCVLGAALIIAAATIWFAYVKKGKLAVIIAVVAVVMYIMLLLTM